MTQQGAVLRQGPSEPCMYGRGRGQGARGTTTTGTSSHLRLVRAKLGIRLLHGGPGLAVSLALPEEPQQVLAADLPDHQGSNTANEWLIRQTALLSRKHRDTVGVICHLHSVWCLLGTRNKER